MSTMTAPFAADSPLKKRTGNSDTHSPSGMCVSLREIPFFKGPNPVRTSRHALAWTLGARSPQRWQSPIEPPDRHTVSTNSVKIHEERGNPSRHRRLASQPRHRVPSVARNLLSRAAKKSTADYADSRGLPPRGQQMHPDRDLRSGCLFHANEDARRILHTISRHTISRSPAVGAVVCRTATGFPSGLGRSFSGTATAGLRLVTTGGALRAALLHSGTAGPIFSTALHSLFAAPQFCRGRTAGLVFRTACHLTLTTIGGFAFGKAHGRQDESRGYKETGKQFCQHDSSPVIENDRLNSQIRAIARMKSGRFHPLRIERHDLRLNTAKRTGTGRAAAQREDFRCWRGADCRRLPSPSMPGR
jgi:hypothetical protein